MVIMLLLILSDGDDPMLAQCCTSVVDCGPALNLHWVIVSWSLCFRFILKHRLPAHHQSVFLEFLEEKAIFPSRQNITVKDYSHQRCHYINNEPPGMHLVPV